MPELPEVETLCRQLNDNPPGRGDPCRRSRSIPAWGKRFRWRENGSCPCERQGKCIRIEMENGLTAVLHLRMTGRLLWQTDDAPVPPYTRLIILFAAGRLVLIDPRRFATFCVRPKDAIPAPLENPLEGLPARRLRKIAGTRRLPVKSFLMDQRFIAGIGNIYACEILYKAAVDPRRQAGSLIDGRMAEGGEGRCHSPPPGGGLPGDDGLRLAGPLRCERHESEQPGGLLAGGVTVPPLWRANRAYDDGRAGNLVLSGLSALEVILLRSR